MTLAPRKRKRLSADAARELGLAQLDRGLDCGTRPMLVPELCRVGSSSASRSPAHSPWLPRRCFFDEATSALDPELVKGILALIADLGGDCITMVVVAHEMASPARKFFNTQHCVITCRLTPTG